MRKALIDAEMELQQGAVATQDKRKTLQARAMLAAIMHPERAVVSDGMVIHCMTTEDCGNDWESVWTW